jgi:hypothetical protein
MGAVFGKASVAEPAFDVLFKHSSGVSYEIRQYGQRFAAEAPYDGDDGSSFKLLARYIGVFGTPENEGQQSIAMTAPVIKEKSAPKAIAMTAPVIKSDSDQKMQFILPAEYDSMSKIPKPTNPAVTILEIPPAKGAVHRYSGSWSDESGRKMAKDLAAQLQKDGLSELTEEEVLERYQWWGFNPPFTLPMFRRNEIWVPLTDVQVEQLMRGFDTTQPN